MTDWNTIQVARNRVAETRKPPVDGFYQSYDCNCERCCIERGQAPIVCGGQGRSAERVGHSGTMLVILTAVAIAYAALAYFVWPTLSKVWQ